LQNLATELNYRLALTLNSLVQLTADAANGVDSNVNIQLANGSYLTANNIRSGIQQLVGVNARPLTKDGMWGGVNKMAPYNLAISGNIRPENGQSRGNPSFKLGESVETTRETVYELSTNVRISGTDDIVRAA
jgi:hypothetical protein